jgi:hypothetical protein
MPLRIQFVGVGGNTVQFTPVVITTNSLPNGAVGVPYTATLTVAGGFPPYVWSIQSGNLPTGLSVDVNGNITGTPSAGGTFNFVVLVVDGPGNSDSVGFTL